MDDLLLQAYGICGNNSKGFVLKDVLRNRDKIGKTFANACASLDHEGFGIINRLIHSPCHVYLLLPYFIVRHHLYNRTSVAKEVGYIVILHFLKSDILLSSPLVMRFMFERCL